MTYAAFPSETDPPFVPALAKVRPSSPWANPAISDRLKELWADHSASEICAKLWQEFRVSVSRNSVIGRLHRLKLTIQHKTKIHPLTNGLTKPRSAGALKPRVRFVRSNSNSNARRVIQTFAPAELKALRCVEITPRHISLLELEANDCRYPYGGDREGDAITFCSHPKMKDRPYCRAHVALTVREPR